VLLTLGFMGFFAFCVLRLHGVAEDDSYIHRRMAAHLATSGHAVFNSGSHTMVTSSPLWTLILAESMRLLPTANSIPLIEAISLLLAGIAAWTLSKSNSELPSKQERALAIVSFLATVLILLPSAMKQMEAPCAFALILTGCVGLVRGRSWSMTLIVLACFTRYECVLFCAMTVIYMTLRRKWTPVSAITSVLFALSGVAWLLWQYGTVIPSTVTAKSHLYAMSHLRVARMLFSSPTSVFLWIVFTLFGGNSAGIEGGIVTLLECC
jgi:hypothetical protein